MCLFRCCWWIHDFHVKMTYSCGTDTTDVISAQNFALFQNIFYLLPTFCRILYSRRFCGCVLFYLCVCTYSCLCILITIIPLLENRPVLYFCKHYSNTNTIISTYNTICFHTFLSLTIFTLGCFIIQEGNTVLQIAETNESDEMVEILKAYEKTLPPDKTKTKSELKPKNNNCVISQYISVQFLERFCYQLHFIIIFNCWMKYKLILLNRLLFVCSLW